MYFNNMLVVSSSFYSSTDLETTKMPSRKGLLMLSYRAPNRF